MDPNEDPSVTAAIVNVVCELGWRRPHDFLPLAPRLFELLVDGGNNWMAIKLIKLVRLNEKTETVAQELKMLTCKVVCDPDTSRTPSCAKAAAAFDKYHSDYTCHVAIV